MVSSRYIGLVLIVALLIPVVKAQTAQPPPTDMNVAVFTKIEQEAQNTRKFTSDELTRQREQFYKQFDERALFYEKEFYDALHTAVLKLSLIWGAIVFLVIGLSNMLRITLERKRFRRMKDTLKDELRTEIFLKNPPKPQAQQETVFSQPNSNLAAYAYKAPQPTLQDKDGFFARRKKHKIAKEIGAVERELEKQETRAAMLRQKLGGNQTPTTFDRQFTAQPAMNNPQNFAPPQRNRTPTSADVAAMTYEYNQQIMQKYIEEQLAKIQQPPKNIPVPPNELKIEVYH